MFTYEKFQMVDDGGMALLVDHNKVRMTMSENQYSFSTMMNLYEDLMSARLRFWPHGRKEGLPESQETEQIEISGGIIDHVFKSDSEKRYNHLFGKVCSAEEFRNLAIVRMNTAYVTLLSMDPIKLHYDPRPIIRLGHGITKAVARYVLSHDIKRQPNNGWKLDTLIHAVAGEISGQPLLNARFRLKQETEALKKIGILITEENRVKRETIPLHNI
jgi:hypothetical protein